MEVIEGGWAKFKEAIGEFSARQLQLIYRAQCNSTWDLVSSWHRISEAEDAASYWPLLNQVHDHISTWTSQHWNLKDNKDLAAFLGFLQHNGFPTPLLDWTMSPYIAAFFAFEGIADRAPQCDAVAVYFFDHLTYMRDWAQVYDLHSATPHVSVLQAFSRGNQKQILQQGVYTFSNVQSQSDHVSRHEAAFSQRTGQTRTYLWKYVISVKEKPLAMRELRLMGINAMTLFPNVEGVCKHRREMYFAPSVVGQTPSDRMEEFYKLIAAHNPQPSPGSLFDPASG